MCVLCIVSTTVYAVFNCVCIIRSSVCSVYVSYAAEARGRRMLAANYNRGAAFSLFIIFVISFYWSLCWCLPNSMPFLHWGFGGSSSFSFTLVCLLSLGTSCTSSLHNWYRVALILKQLQGWPRGRQWTLMQGVPCLKDLLPAYYHVSDIHLTYLLHHCRIKRYIPLWIPPYHSFLKDAGRKRFFCKVWISS